jgi:hypothetical protein
MGLKVKCYKCPSGLDNLRYRDWGGGGYRFKVPFYHPSNQALKYQKIKVLPVGKLSSSTDFPVVFSK